MGGSSFVIYLWCFRRHSTVQEADKKKARKRNLVPARIGALQMIIYITTYSIFVFVYAACYLNLDAATKFVFVIQTTLIFITILPRAFILAFYNDIIICVVRPFIRQLRMPQYIN